VGFGSLNNKFRDLALWAVYRFKQVAEEALYTFGDMPAKENLPIIMTVWNEFSARHCWR
jgi:hypothetical protein